MCTPTTSLWLCLQVNAHVREKPSVTFILKTTPKCKFLITFTILIYCEGNTLPGPWLSVFHEKAEKQ